MEFASRDAAGILETLRQRYIPGSPPDVGRPLIVAVFERASDEGRGEVEHVVHAKRNGGVIEPRAKVAEIIIFKGALGATTDQLSRAILLRGTSFKRLQTNWRKAKGPGQIAYRYCSAITHDGWPWIVDAHRKGRRYIVHSDEKWSGTRYP